jgi:catechol 2,3-dioxygenase-like lactoylglutathione lyase family enzyme
MAISISWTFCFLIFPASLLPCNAQTPGERVITGGMNAEFTVADQESSIAFYQNVLGLGAPIARVNPPAAAVGQLTGTVTGAAHVARMPIPGASWTMEIVETTGVERKPVAARRQDIGASGLILYVRDLNAALAALKKANATIVTTSGQAVHLKAGYRAIMTKDPNGFFVELRQTDQPRETTASASGNVIGAAISISIENTEKTARYWHEVLDFDVNSASEFIRDKKELALLGTPGAKVRKSTATYPGSDVAFEFLEFEGVDRKALHPHTQDPGSGAFAITSRDMAAFVKRVKSNPEGKILTVGDDALNQGARIAMFMQEPNGFILEVIQPLNRSKKE